MRQVGVSYKQCSMEDSYDAIVIGSGAGGLTAAALLARHGGRKVAVLERHYTAGGYTHVFRRPGYEWDVGVHYVGRVNNPRDPVRAAFDHLTGGRLQWNPMPDVYDRIHIADRAYDFPSGLESFRARMKGYFPEEVRAIDQYIAAVLAAARASGAYFAEKAIPAPIARIIGSFLRSRFLRYADQTTAQVLDQFTRNRELIAVLTGQWGDYGLPPSQSSFGMHALVAYHFFEDSAYPVGGASEIAAAIAPEIEAAGGKIAVSAEVAGILLDRRERAIGVRMADGRDIRARTVISDAGAPNTFARLLPPEVSARLDILTRIREIPPSMAHICLYAGLMQEPGQPGPGAANLWLYPGPDSDADFARFQTDPSAPLPLVFVSFPSAKDPTFAERYPGRATIEAIAPVPYGWFEKWADSRWKHRGPDYDELKGSFTARLVEAVERHVPAVRGKVDYTELSTPLSTRHFANHASGEVYGLSATPARYRIRALGARTPIPNLYLTGADVTSAGVAGAMFSGVVTASAILRRNLMSVVSRPYTAPRS